MIKNQQISPETPIQRWFSPPKHSEHPFANTAPAKPKGIPCRPGWLSSCSWLGNNLGKQGLDLSWQISDIVIQDELQIVRSKLREWQETPGTGVLFDRAILRLRLEGRLGQVLKRRGGKKTVKCF